MGWCGNFHVTTPHGLHGFFRRLDVGMNINTDGLVGKIDIGPRDVEDWREFAVVMTAAGFFP